MKALDRFADLDSSRKVILICGLALLVFIAWASIAKVDEVTRGMGKIIPSSKAQLIQPSEPAVVSEILVRGGQMVKQGQILVRLDDSMSASQLGELQAENERLAARSQRLAGEAGGNGLSDCQPGTICADERQLQQARVSAARSREAALASAIEQRRRDLSEAQATISSLESSAQLAQEQVNMLRPLAEQGIVPQTELLTAQRDLVDTRGRLAAARQAAGRAQASIAQAQSDLSAARLDFRQQALNERSEVQTRLAVNSESLRGAEARQQRNELRAPADGIVNDVQITTVGGYVNAGENLMQVIPVGDTLLVEARVKPSDIAFIKVGDRANVRVTAYDFSIYGGLPGRVEQISADSIYDEATQETYYSVLVQTEKAYIQAGNQRLPIVPGMMCDVEIITGRKSILTYLLKPIEKALGSAFTER